MAYNKNGAFVRRFGKDVKPVSREAFTAGVKPGSITTTTQIRILLCYVIRTVAQPLSRAELEQALMEKELVNYFELAAGLSDLENQELVTVENGRYRITPKGRSVADLLLTDLPRSVREQAVQAAVLAQQWARKAAQHQAAVLPDDRGFCVDCHIKQENRDVFRLQVSMPDQATAECARDAFIEKGGELYKVMLAALSGHKDLAIQWLRQL